MKCVIPKFEMTLLSVTINTIDLNYVTKSQILNSISRNLLYRNALYYQSPLWFHLDKTTVIRRESGRLYQDGTKEDSNITKRSNTTVYEKLRIIMMRVL